MKKLKITYWLVTGLFAAIMLASAIPDILIDPRAVQGFKEMGMPAYLILFLGVAKLLGVLAILVPGFARLKEWAYAGLVFDLVGATYGVMAIGKSVLAWAPLVVILALGFCSYALYHKKQKASAVAKNKAPGTYAGTKNTTALIA